MARAAATQAARTPPSDEVAQERSARQVEHLVALDRLRALPEAELRLLAELATLRIFAEGSPMIAEDFVGDHLFVLLHGFARMTLHDKAGHEVLLGMLGRGDVFGEGLLFGDHVRRATVVGETACAVLQLPLDALREQLGRLQATAAELRRCYRARLVESTLGRVPLFGSLSAVERGGIARLLRQHSYGRGAEIVREDEPGDALYLLEDGQVTIEQHDQVIAHLEEGDFFGEMSLLHRRPHNATVRALTPVEVLVLPGDSFHDLLAQQPELAAQLRVAADERLRTGERMRKDMLRTQQLDQALRDGLLRGSHLLVRDPALCEPGCQRCDQACAQRHGQTRLKAEHLKLDQIDVLDACRQCRFGAECSEACPEDAFRWDSQGALVITDNCNGCGACAPACPYGAIRMIALDTPHSTPLWRLWQGLRSWHKPIIPLETLNPNQRADKCDYCHGYDELACVSACPTGALRLVPIEELLPL